MSQQVFVPAAGQPAASAKNGCNRIGLTRPDFEHEQATWGQMLFSFSRQPPVKGKAVRTAIQGFNRLMDRHFRHQAADRFRHNVGRVGQDQVKRLKALGPDIGPDQPDRISRQDGSGVGGSGFKRFSGCPPGNGPKAIPLFSDGRPG